MQANILLKVYTVEPLEIENWPFAKDYAKEKIKSGFKIYILRQWYGHWLRE